MFVLAAVVGCSSGKGSAPDSALDADGSTVSDTHSAASDATKGGESSAASDSSTDMGVAADSAPDAQVASDSVGTATADAIADTFDGNPVNCTSPVPADPNLAARTACTFTAGATTDSTLGSVSAARANIKNIIVMMKENRSFDSLLGQLAASGLQPDAEPMLTTFTNPDTNTPPVQIAVQHATTTCIGSDPGHQWVEMHNQVDGGKMDGFVKNAATTTNTSGVFSMFYYTQDDLPFYYWLASTYALNDRHFASARTGTYPDRDFLMLGTADGVTCTGCGYPSTSLPTIFSKLTAAGVTWGVYSDGSILSGTLNWTTANPNVYSFGTFMTQLQAGTLPQVAFVDGVDNVTDDHPTADLQMGEMWTREIYQAAVASSLWPHLAILWTYDEGGGFFDHVAPPNAGCASGNANDATQGSNELGVRVPMAVISPYARRHYVSHIAQEHTSLTRFIETVFSLTAMTNRDANADALLDMFDFNCPPMLTPPAAPDSGSGGCGGVIVTSAQANYTVGQTITISYKNGPGQYVKDWIGIYNYGQTPIAGSLAWEYVSSDTHTAGTTDPTSGSVTITSTSVNVAKWPLPVGQYIAYYLQDDGYTPLGSVDFNVIQ
jgi:phospholipase C